MENAQQEKKFNMMTTSPVEKLVGKMAVPSIISMLISSVYNMADTMYVGRIDTQATGAVGIVFSYMALIQSIAFFLGQGSANYISRALGAKDSSNASRMAATGFFTSVICGTVIAVFGLIFTEPILRFLGSTETILPRAKEYFFYILIGTPFIMSSFVMNNQMRLQGNALMGMIGISVGAVLNICLDPILIFTLGMGVKGASLATAISQTVSFIILFFLCDKRGGIAIKLKNFRPTFSQYKEITAGGLPSLGRQGLASVAGICLNRLARLYGGVYADAAIAAFSVVNRVTMFSSSALIGFGQGFQPVCGFNYGAKLYPRVRKAVKFCIIVGTVYCSVMALAGALFAPQIITLFRPDDAELIRIGAKALRLQSFVYPLLGYVVITNMFLQTIRRSVSATILAASRQGIFYIPVLYICAALFGINGILFAQPISDVLSFALSIPFGIAGINSTKKAENALPEKNENKQ